MDDEPRTISVTSQPPLPRLMQGSVRVVNGPGRGTRKPCGDAPLVVGSDSGCGLTIPDRRVSRRHCEIRLGRRGFMVRDLQSHNGTWFEGSRIIEIAVPPGALIKIGATFLHLGVTEDAAGVEPSDRDCFGRLVGASAEMRRLYALLERAALCDASVLLLGETGTGKELAARAIHAESARSGAAFEVFDCGAAHQDLIRTALFGYVEGSFTGAGAGQPGVFERADGGTVFLDELGEIPLQLQPTLLRVCEERTVCRVGSNTPVKVDVRIVAATNRDLAEEVAAGRFREDLYYRLQVMTINVPPLRRHREDLPPLCRRLLHDLGARRSGPIEGPGLSRLLQHDWPGNVRELRNVLERALAVAGPEAPFSELDLAPEPSSERSRASADASFQERKREVVERFERRFLGELLEECAGNIRRASRASGIERSQLKRLLRKHGLI